MRRCLAFSLRLELAFGLLSRFPLVALVAAFDDDVAKNVVRELDAAKIQPLLDAKKASIDEERQRARLRARVIEGAQHALLGEALAEARLGEHLVFDEPPHARR